MVPPPALLSVASYYRGKKYTQPTSTGGSSGLPEIIFALYRQLCWLEIGEIRAV
jgi:hypothetical protein